MDILAIESSSTRGSLALWREGRIVAEEEFRSDRAHNSVLFVPLERILKQAGTLRCIVCGTGPGSYTGVRVGIAAAIGISLAKKAPLIGLPSVLALEDGNYAVCGDARRGSWWWAEVTGGRLSVLPSAASLEEVTQSARAWPGSILTVDDASPPFCQAVPATPCARILASLAAVMPDEEIARLAAQSVEPVYLAAPFITVSKKPVFA
jgi:tRNA threonylcarbamoyladenosine biosynthesis protein TsaB